MKRNINQLAQQHFDIIIIGAGVHGACIARDAALRGLKVALVDKGDICGQTSHNSLKIIHGGIRYLQHLDIKRTWESIQEQKIWLTIAPHLTKPIQCIMPTYGHGMRGPEVMWCGIKAYELLGLGRNRSIPVQRRIPKGKVVSRKKCLELVPGIKSTNLTGAAIWYDAQVFGADEAVIETADSATHCGAQVANYVNIQRVLTAGQKVIGVRAKDELTQEIFDIHSDLVINAAGPWAKELLATLNISKFDEFDLPLTKSMNIVTRPLFGDYAVAIQSKRQSDSVVGSTNRLYFFTPWKDCTVTGTTHFPYNGDPDSLKTTPEEVHQFISEINEVYPQAKLTLEDVRYCYKGLTPAEEPQTGKSSSSEVIRSHHSKIIDHSDDNIEGFISIIGVKYTTARLIAEKCINLAFRKLGKKDPGCLTKKQPLEGSTKATIEVEKLDHDGFSRFCRDQIKNSMAIHLSDLVLRRMNLAMQGQLNLERLTFCLELMSKEFDWSSKQQLREVQDLTKIWLSPDLKQNIKKLANLIELKTVDPYKK